MKKRVVIFAAGEYFGEPHILPGDFVIAADGGYDFCVAHGIHPDFIIGDFDSNRFTPSGDNVAVLPCAKDDTDTAAAVDYALKKGFNSFHIYGATGGSLSHTLANITIVTALAAPGMECFLYGDGVVITAIRDRSIVLHPPESADNKGISVFSASDKSDGINLRGLCYNLEDAVFLSTVAHGVSNEFTDENAFIEVKNGCLLLIYDSGASILE
jgi:thiamine pyrophosphokinase